jgi:DNA-binding MarR family transcriptional regulator
LATKPEPLKPTADLDLSALEPNFGLSVRLLDLRMMKRATEAFSSLGLTPASATALLIVQANPGIRHGELADTLLIQRPNMTKLLKQLVDAGWLRRDGSDGDRRHVMFSLSPEGMRLATRARVTIEGLDAENLSGLSAEDQRSLAALIEKLSRSLDERAEDAPSRDAAE